nr:hypothetical protein [Plesiomonas shigelloides]
MSVGGSSALFSALLITDRLTPCGSQSRILRLPSFLLAQTRSSSVFCLLSSVFCLLSSVFCLLSGQNAPVPRPPKANIKTRPNNI